MAVQKQGAPGHTGIAVQKHRGILVWFLALTTLYNVVYQFVAWYTQQSEWPQDVCMNAGSDSPQCLEQSFRDAQRELATAEKDDMDGDDLDPSLMLLRKMDEVSNAILESLNDDSVQPYAQSLASLQMDMEAHHDNLLSTTLRDRAKFDRIYDETLQALSVEKNTTWTQETLALQQQMEMRAGLRSQRRKLTLDSTSATDFTTRWGRGLLDFQARMQGEHDLLRSRQLERQMQFDTIYNTSVEPLVSNSDHSTPWSRDILAMQDRLQARMHTRRDRLSASSTKTMQLFEEEIWNYGRTLCEDPRRHGTPACARFLPVAVEAPRNAPPSGFLQEIRAGREVWEHPLEIEANDYARSLCADRSRRHYPACARFQARYEAMNFLNNFPTARQESQPWDESIREQVHSVGRELCAHPQRRNEPSCAQFLAHDDAVEEQLMNDTYELGEWANKITDMQSRMEERMERRARRQRRRNHIRESFGVHEGSNRAWERSLVDEANNVGRGLCESLERKDHPSCAQFL